MKSVDFVKLELERVSEELKRVSADWRNGMNYSPKEIKKYLNGDGDFPVLSEKDGVEMWLVANLAGQMEQLKKQESMLKYLITQMKGKN